MTEPSIKITDMELIPQWNRNQKTAAVFSAQFFGLLTVHDFLLRWNRGDPGGWFIRYPYHMPINAVILSAKSSSRTVLAMKQQMFDALLYEAVEEYIRRVEAMELREDGADTEPIEIEQEQRDVTATEGTEEAGQSESV